MASLFRLDPGLGDFLSPCLQKMRGVHWISTSTRGAQFFFCLERPDLTTSCEVILSLVGGLEPWDFMTFHILGIVTPSDFHIFQR